MSIQYNAHSISEIFIGSDNKIISYIKIAKCPVFLLLYFSVFLRCLI